MTQSSPGYEKQDVNVVRIIGVTVAIVVFLVAVLVFLREYFIYEREKMVYETKLKPESVALRDLRAAEDEILTSYKILDAESGVYQIPLERAMQLLADEAYQKTQVK